MVDVNNCSRKRKLSEGTFEVSKDEVSIPSQIEQSEPEAKMVRTENLAKSEEGSLSQDILVNNVEITEVDSCLQERLVTLEEENLNLKRELQNASLKICKCNVDVNISSLSDEDVPIITIKFFNQTIAEAYKSKFLNFLKGVKEFTHEINDLEISIRKEGIENKDVDPNCPDSNRKRKRKKSKTKDFFMVDTTPSLVTKEYIDLKYTSKYTVQVLEENSEKSEMKTGTSTCFNCNKNHNLRDCPQPKDYSKINAARQKMKAQHALKIRYHMDEEQKYAHLIPGKISDQLREALGIRANELPAYIYRMRRFGYPPGWILDATIEHSNLSLYDIDGKEYFNGKNKLCTNVDIEKIVEYPGFNMPMEPGIKDDYRFHDCPSFSERCSKAAMIAFLKEAYAKERDNNEVSDMDLEKGADDDIVPPGCEDVQRLSPSLIDLEKKKLELLAELDNGGNSTDSEGKKETLQLSTQPENNNKVSEEKNVDCNITKETANKDTTNGVIATPVSPSDNVKLSSLGTPIIQSTSPFCTLPHPEKFSKDVSPVINFENLPNSTGKYEQMVGVLQKVRKTLKDINNKS